MSSLLRLEQQGKDFLNSTTNSQQIRNKFSFTSYSLGTELVVPSKTIPNYRQKWEKSIPVSR